ncbi:fdrA domain protein [Vulcanisaeta thermophila]|uniref:fdrA domain protein n=1 Tax=Vulcanisaeta thermophila TaxID=867917 RepID=UPI00117F60DF|nr:fdrA domain protein [Vulcanisaeta thermophila]
MTIKIKSGKIKVLNIGIELFYSELKKQGIDVIHVEWKPPIKLEKEIEDILSKVM